MGRFVNYYTNCVLTNVGAMGEQNGTNVSHIFNLFYVNRHDIVATDQACTVTLLTRRAIRGSTDFLRSTGGSAYSSSARLWERNHAIRAQAAALIAFDGWKFPRIALDGSRLGKPAEETYVYCMWEAVTSKFFPMAPEVIDGMHIGWFSFFFIHVIDRFMTYVFFLSVY